MRPIISNTTLGTRCDHEEIRRGNHPPQPPWCSIRDPRVLDNQCQPFAKLSDLCLNVLPCSRPISTSLPAIQQTAVDYTLHSKPWAGHPVGEKKLIRHRPCPQDTDDLVRKPRNLMHRSLI